MPTDSKLIDYPATPKNLLLSIAYVILCDGIDSVNNLESHFSGIRELREEKRGASSVAEQDFLRAMVVMAGATVDACIKRVIADSYPALIKSNNDALRKAQESLQSRLQKKIQTDGGKLLASALLSDNPRDAIIQSIVDGLIGGSLQNVKELEKVESFLGIRVVKNEKLYKAFEARNKIIHELDSLHGQGASRKRQSRSWTEMTGYSKELISTATKFLEKVDIQLT